MLSSRKRHGAFLIADIVLFVLSIKELLELPFAYVDFLFCVADVVVVDDADELLKVPKN